jgi:hypothetical protein
VHLVGFIIRIYHDARSSKCHIYQISCCNTWQYQRLISKIQNIPSSSVYLSITGVNLTTRRHFVSSLRIIKLYPCSSYVFSWHGLGQLYLYFTTPFSEQDMPICQLIVFTNINASRDPANGNCVSFMLCIPLFCKPMLPTH